MPVKIKIAAGDFLQIVVMQACSAFPLSPKIVFGEMDGLIYVRCGLFSSQNDGTTILMYVCLSPPSQPKLRGLPGGLSSASELVRITSSS